MMYRFYVYVAISVIISTLTTARRGHASNESLSQSHEDDCKRSKNFTGSKESAEMDSGANFTLSAMVNGTNGNESAIISNSSIISNSTDDKENATLPSIHEKVTPWKRAINSVELAKSSSSSEDHEGSGFGDSETNRTFKDDNLNVSDTNSTNNRSVAVVSDAVSKELGSGDKVPAGIMSNEVLDPQEAHMEQIAILKKKVQEWQNAVTNYLQAGRQRRKRQTWSQLFPPPSTGASSNPAHPQGKNIKDSASSFVSAAGSAVGDALKPAMELMTQGVSLLSDLYTAQLSKPNVNSKPRITSENTTEVVDQFRDQLTQLQTKLSDLGETLQRVVSSFHEMQVPFLDNILSGGVLTVNGIPAGNPGNNRKNVLNEYNIPQNNRKNV